MKTEQLRILQHVIDSLEDPKLSPYYGMPFYEASHILAEQLKQVRDYETSTNTSIVS